MLLSRDIRLVIYGIVITAYMTMSYEIVKDFMKKPIDTNDIISTAIAGLFSLGVGIGAFFFLTHKKLT